MKLFRFVLPLLAVCPMFAQLEYRDAVKQTTTGDLTFSAGWLTFNRADLSTLRVAVQTTNPLTDGFRVTFLLKHNGASGRVQQIIVRNKQISYPSGLVYPFPALLDMPGISSDSQISEFTVDEIQFVVISQ